jgi:nucleoside-diphosphate-sugar epimerase
MVPMLLEDGYEVIGFDSDLFRNCTYGNTLPKIEEKIKDIRDVTIDDCRDIDAVIHLAALSNDPLGNINPNLTYEINYRSSVKIAQLAKEAGVSRYLFSSSCSTYGAAGDDMLTEGATFNPVTPYGKSKVLAEQEISKLADADFSPTFLRNATAYGISPRHRFDIVLNNLVAWAYTKGLVYLKSDGTPWRPIIHIEDIARAFIAALKAPKEKIYNQAFNVGINDENYRIRDLAEIVKKTVPDCRIQYAKDAGPDKRNYRVDFTKINKQLPEFQPKWTAALGAEQLYSSYQEFGLNLEEFEGPKYQRISHIKELLNSGKLNTELRWISVS